MIWVTFLCLFTIRLSECYKVGEARIHTLFSTECNNYFDWQTVGIMHSYRKSGHPGPITRLLSCTEEQKRQYRGFDLAPTMEVPSMSRHPITGDWYVVSPSQLSHSKFSWLLFLSNACFRTVLIISFLGIIFGGIFSKNDSILITKDGIFFYTYKVLYIKT